MLFVIIGTVSLAALIWFLVKKDPDPLLGVYSQPGIICCLINSITSACISLNTASEQAYEFGSFFHLLLSP